MQKSKQLHKLIHSLSKSEKRYFRLSNTVSGRNTIYLKIFDQILNQAVYNAIPLKALLKEEGNKSSLPRLQNYLYDLILKTLANYHQEHHPRYQVMQWIQQYIILRDRGLRQQGKQLLEKALNLSQANNYLGLVAEIVDLMEDWVTEEDDYKNAQTYTSKLVQLHDANIQQQDRLSQLKQRIYQLRLFFLEHGFIRNQEQQIQLKEWLIEAEVALKQEDNPLNRRLLLTILTYISYAFQNFEQLFNTELQRLELVNQAAWSAHISPFLTYAFHRNLLWLTLQTKQYAQYDTTIQNISNIYKLPSVKYSTYYKTKLEIAATVSQLIKSVETFHFREAYLQIPQIKQLYKTAAVFFDMDVLMRAAILSVYVSFSLQKYEESLYWLQFMDMNVQQSSKLPYQNIGKIVGLLIHDALGNKRLIQNMLTSTRIGLYRKQQFFDVATLFIKLFQKLSKTTSAEEEKNLLKIYRTKLQAISQKPERRGFFVLFNFLDWFDSKLQGISIADLLRQRQLS
ncbi:MAG: hypothetical protein GY810_29595 [Aureispira sp.]|nr:hypothetical protein [Aureispira sp.]